MINDLVSIIIPYYKKKFFFLDCFKSAYFQSYKKKEIIIIYDDENLEELKYIKKITSKKRNVKIVVNKKNYGAGQSRNIGIKLSKGEFIAFIDADDFWYKNKLKDQINFMKLNNVDISYTSYKIINEKNKYVGFRKCDKYTNFNKLLKDCNIGLSTAIIRRSKKKYGHLHFPKLKTKEDYVLWLKLSKEKLNFMGLLKPYSCWRKTKNSLSSNLSQKLKDGFNVYFKYLKFNFFKSIFYLTLLSFNYLKKTISD